MRSAFSDVKAHLSKLTVVCQDERLPRLHENEMFMPLGHQFGDTDCQLSTHPQMQPEPNIS